MKWAGLLLALAGPVTTADAMAATRGVVIGEIVIRYDDTRFRLLSRPPRPWPSSIDTARHYVGFVCIDRSACFNEAILAVTTMPAEDPDEPAHPTPEWIEEPRDLWRDGVGLLDLGGTKRDFGGLVLSGTMTYSRCRSAGGIRFEATGVLGGTRYVFSAGRPTCGGGPQGVPQATFEELLAGIAVLPNAR